MEGCLASKIILGGWIEGEHFLPHHDLLYTFKVTNPFEACHFGVKTRFFFSRLPQKRNDNAMLIISPPPSSASSVPKTPPATQCRQQPPQLWTAPWGNSTEVTRCPGQVPFFRHHPFSRYRDKVALSRRRQHKNDSEKKQLLRFAV